MFTASCVTIVANVLHFANNQRPVVLLVDPDFVTRSALAAYLRQRDLSVLEAVSGQEALTVLRSNRIVHALFCPSDLDGEVRGLEFVRIVCRDFSGVKVLLNAARPEHGNKQTKPFTVVGRPYPFAVVEHHLRDLLFERTGQPDRIDDAT